MEPISVVDGKIFKNVLDESESGEWKFEPKGGAESVYIPYKNGVYERSLALALFEITANITQDLKMSSKKFNNKLCIEGIDPVSGKLTMFAYIFWNRNSHEVCIAFKGTKTLSELISDFKFSQVKPKILNGYEEGVLVHKGFYDIYLAIRDKLWIWWYENQEWIKTLYITGISMGGALSTICSYDFAKVFSCRRNKANNSKSGKFKIHNLPIHYSFAAPRCGNKDFAKIFKERLPTSIRVNNTEDIIPQLPFAQQGPYTYEQTIGNVPFTASLGSLLLNHTKAYYEYMPHCPEVAPCCF